ncbi:phage major capsid protein [Anaplasmataceae bacterium AB001_6]|nr:phage major capsid protein [Anaplasmataceae bacterium AB001_6]
MTIEIISENITKITNDLNNIQDTLQSFDCTIAKNESRLSALENVHSRPLLNDCWSLEGKKSVFYRSLSKFILKRGNNDNFKDSLSEGEDCKHLQNCLDTIFQEKSALRSLCSVDKVSSSSVTYVHYGDIDSTVNWGNNIIDTPGALIEEKIDVCNVHAQTVLSNSLIDDINFNVEEWVDNQIIAALLRAEDQAFISGDGNNKPSGMLLAANADNTKPITLAADTTLTVDDLLDFYYSLPLKYVDSNIAFIMHRTVLQNLRSLKEDCTNSYIWSPTGFNGEQETLFGIPVFEIYGMPEWDNTEEKPVIILGNFKQAYKIVDLLEFDIMKDQYSNKPNTIFYATSRVGGAVLNSEALRFLTIKRV